MWCLGSHTSWNREVQDKSLSRSELTTTRNQVGRNWHFRSLRLNYCYIVLETVEFYLHKRQPLQEFVPAQGKPLCNPRDLGYMLTFSFVRGDGTPSDFGKNKYFMNNDTLLICTNVMTRLVGRPTRLHSQ